MLAPKARAREKNKKTGFWQMFGTTKVLFPQHCIQRNVTQCSGIQHKRTEPFLPNKQNRNSSGSVCLEEMAVFFLRNRFVLIFATPFAVGTMALLLVIEHRLHLDIE